VFKTEEAYIMHYEKSGDTMELQGRGWQMGRLEADYCKFAVIVLVI
jgi:hypothetical protein